MVEGKRKAKARHSPQTTHDAPACLPPAAIDPLTGLPDRHTFLLHLRHATKRSQSDPHYRFAVCFLDLDGFKIVNRRYGHLVGDRFLRAAAKRLQAAISHEGDLLARFGGDEFTALLKNVSNAAAALHRARQFHKQLRRALTCGKRKAHLGVSIGVVLSSPAYRRAETLLRLADKAMFAAKAQGGNQAVLYEKHSKSNRLN